MIVLPSEFPEVRSYPRLRRLLQVHIDMQFADLRDLLKLPKDGVTGANLTTAALLANMIAGSSVLFFEASVEALTSRGNRGDRFRRLLETHFPWLHEPVPKGEGIAALYELVRNPLAHSFGLSMEEGVGPNPMAIVLNKWSLTDEQIRQLEDQALKPDWAGPVVSPKRLLADGTTEVVVSIPALYWGLHRTLHSLLSVPRNAQQADAVADIFLRLWNKFISDSAHGEDSISVRRTCSTCGSELVPVTGQSAYRCPRGHS